MGCDIHMMLEVPIDNDSPEEYTLLDYELPHNFRALGYRNYAFFGYIAQVRTRPPSFMATALDPRGVPDDISEETRQVIENWGVDGHSHTWLDISDTGDMLQELRIRSLKSPPKHYHDDYYDDLLKKVVLMHRMFTEYPNSRLIIFFDN